MNSPTDNPLVYFKGEENFTKDTLISAGNFHG
jgi:histidine ammonia-lyase